MKAGEKELRNDGVSVHVSAIVTFNEVVLVCLPQDIKCIATQIALYPMSRK